MRKFFYSLIPLLLFFHSMHLSASETNASVIKNYVYDDEGQPVFIKIYVTSPKIKASMSPLQAGMQQILSRISQEDQRGDYIVVPIKNKKDKRTHEEESSWKCPCCNKKNPSFNNKCGKKSCILH